MEQKDTISQLNMLISSQNELIASLRSARCTNKETVRVRTAVEGERAHL